MFMNLPLLFYALTFAWDTESCEGLSTRMSTHPQPAAVFNVQMSQVQSKLESELKEIEEQIQKARRRKSFTKEELQAKLQEFVPHASNKSKFLVEQGSSSSLELPSENIGIQKQNKNSFSLYSVKLETRMPTPLDETN